MSGVGDHDARIGRVEGEVQTIRTEMVDLKSDVKGLGAILDRIEQGVLRAQDKSEEREVAGKPNLVALVSVLITIISIIVGGAWIISGALSRQDERSIGLQRQIDRNDQRLWDDHNKGAASGARDVTQ